MAKLVEFLQPMAPHNVGDIRVVGDEVAERLVAEGSAKILPSAFDKRSDRMLLPETPPAVRPGRRYLTR